MPTQPAARHSQIGSHAPDEGTGERREHVISRLFRIGLWLKAANAVVELTTGFAVLFASDAILNVTRALTRHELLTDPNDVIANALIRWAEAMALSQRVGVSLYLLSHGALKLFLVAMLLRGKEWAYPVFIAVLTILIAYQTYQLVLLFSFWLVVLTVFDVVILYLTIHEYRLVRRAKLIGKPAGS